MTYDGSLKVTNTNPVKIPSVKTLNYGTTLTASDSPPSHLWKDADYFYVTSFGTVYSSLATDPANFTIDESSGLGVYFCYVTENAIGSYFYAFGTTTDLGGPATNGLIYRAHITTPSAWVSTGSSIAVNSNAGSLYVDNTYVWIFGGIDGGTYDTVQRATLADPLTWTDVGSLAIGVSYGALAVVGANLYLYGGVDDTTTSRDVIQTATVADPTTWTDTLAVIPATLDAATSYVDGTTIYLFGGHDGGLTINEIYTAPIGTPTVMSLEAGSNLGDSGARGHVMVDSPYLYLITTIGLQRAELTDLITTWETVNNTLAVATTHACSAIVGDNIYVFGGRSSAAAALDTIQTATVSNPTYFTDLSPVVLPAAIQGGQIIKTSLYLYILGGNGVTGSYYRAALSAPTTWTLVSTGGPNVPHGRALVQGNYVYYFGGEITAGMDTTSIVWRGAIQNGEISDDSWIITSANFPTGFPSLARFNLVVSGEWAYVIGGYSESSMNTSVYRANMNQLVKSTAWLNVGTIPTPFADSTVIPISNGVYLVGGSSSVALTSHDDQAIYASMTDLANGIAMFTTENTFSAAIFAGAEPVCVDDVVYVYGTKNGNNGSNFILRTHAYSEHLLAMPNIPESRNGMVTIDTRSGSLGTYNSFQKTGMLPWLVTNK